MKFIFQTCLFLFIAVPALAGDWQVDKKADNSVVFHSTTTLLDFEGVTDKIDGYIFWDGKDPFSGKNEVYFEVALASFETGIGKRDSDMREDVLNTNKFPVSSFKGEFVKVTKSKSQYNLTVAGELDLHGIKKKMEIHGIITIKNGVMHVKSNFSIFLKDFKIEAPSLAAFIKVAEEIKLSLDFYLVEDK